MNILQMKKILHPNQSRVIEEAKFTLFPLGKALEKQRITIKDKKNKNNNNNNKKRIQAVKNLNLANKE